MLRAAKSQRRTPCQTLKGTFHVIPAALRAQRAGEMRRSWQVLRSSYMVSPWPGHLKRRLQQAKAGHEQNMLWGWAQPPTMACTGGLALSQTLLPPGCLRPQKLARALKAWLEWIRSCCGYLPPAFPLPPRATDSTARSGHCHSKWSMKGPLHPCISPPRTPNPPQLQSIFPCGAAPEKQGQDGVSGQSQDTSEAGHLKGF